MVHSRGGSTLHRLGQTLNACNLKQKERLGRGMSPPAQVFHLSVYNSNAWQRYSRSSWNRWSTTFCCFTHLNTNTNTCRSDCLAFELSMCSCSSRAELSTSSFHFWLQVLLRIPHCLQRQWMVAGISLDLQQSPEICGLRSLQAQLGGSSKTQITSQHFDGHHLIFCLLIVVST